MISTRLNDFLKHLELTPYQFEKAIGATKNSIAIPIKNGTTIGSEILGKIFTHYPEINLAWLIAGVGGMFNAATEIDKKASGVYPGEGEEKPYLIPVPKPVPSTKSEKSGTDKANSILTGDDSEDVYLKRIPNSIPTSKSKDLGIQKEWGTSRLQTSKFSANSANSVSIDIIDVRAAANWSGVAIAEDNPETLGTLALPAKMLQKGLHKAFTVVGDSMEPTLYPGDYVVAKLIERGNYDQIRDHFIYIVATNEGVVIKRLLNRLKQRGEIRCRSDNRKYSAYNIDESDIVAVFEAKAKLSFNFTNEQGNLFDMYHDLEERLANIETTIKSKSK